MLVSTPLIRTLKRRLPDITLDILVSTNNVMAADGIPFLGKRWVYRKNLWSIIALLRMLRREQYDVAVDLMDNPSATSTLLCLFSGARWTIGIEKANAYAYDVTVPLLSRKNVHIVRRIAELLRPFGIDPDREDLSIVYEPGQSARQRAHRMMVSEGLRGKRPLCVNISAGSPARFWGVPNYRALLKGIRSRFPDIPVVVVSSPKDEAFARAIIDSMSDVRMLPPTADFQEFASTIREMGAIVTPDTAVVHLAAAFHIPSVVLYIQTDSSLKIWEPYGAPHRALISEEDSLRSIVPDDVLGALEDLLAVHARSERRAPVKKR